MEHGRANIKHVGVDEEASFLCVRCDASAGCMVCHQDKVPKEVEEDTTKEKVTEAENKEAEGVDGDVKMKEGEDEEEEMLRFRCVRCKQEAHYQHCEPLSGRVTDRNRADIRKWKILSKRRNPLAWPRSQTITRKQPRKVETAGNAINVALGSGP